MRLIDMTKTFKNYLLNIFSVIGPLVIGYRVCALFDAFPHTEIQQFTQIQVGIVVVGIIAFVWFVWRGYDGFFRKMDFWVDEKDHRW
jgi:hypothetical protein